ncbi:MAG: efflux RND transporter periplasmic adaptor subunit [Pseudomonadales bacterium]
MPKRLLPLVILAVALGLAVLAFLNPPRSERIVETEPNRLAVEVLELEAKPYRVLLQSYGTVRPRTQSELVPQVSGKIVSISPNFRNGGFFEAGELLVQIDERDYRAEESRARASLIEARQALVQEQAQVDQAREDWLRLGNKGEPPALVSREPQFKAAQARVLAAEAALDTAEANLDRTRIVAPYAGRMLEKKVDVGQVVSANTSLADIYAVDTIEVRLPLKNRDLPFINLPESYRFAEVEHSLPAVKLLSDLARSEQWQGRIVRTEGAIDAASQQLYVIAQIDDPYGEQFRDKQPLKIGQYVTAEIEGRELPDALVIPTRTIYQGTYVYTVHEGKLLRRDISIGWQNAEEALVVSGLEAGDLLVITPLGQVASGTLVKIVSADNAQNEALSQSKADAGPTAGTL